MNVALIGIGGYGTNYVTGMLDAKAREDVHFVAAVEPFPSSCTRLNEIVASGVRIYSTLDAMYAEHRPDLVVISSPIQLHCEQTVAALEQGSHVLCEKPLCASVEQIDHMICGARSSEEAGSHRISVAVLTGVPRTEEGLQRGPARRTIRLSTFVCWPREFRYYRRNRWAGRQFDDAGRPVFDSPVNNACSHYLHNMLNLIGARCDRGDVAHDLTAELYRANAIENFEPRRFVSGRRAAHRSSFSRRTRSAEFMAHCFDTNLRRPSSPSTITRETASSLASMMGPFANTEPSAAASASCG